MNKEKRVHAVKSTRCSHHPQQSEALLFQFALHELLATCQILCEPVSISLFQKLVGDLCQFHTPYLLSSRHLGSLLKLHHYLSSMELHFPKRNSTKNPLFKKILESSEKAICLAVDCQRSFEKDIALFQHIFKKLQSQIRKLKTLLPERTLCYEKNEHLLFFLLKRESDFDHLVSKKLVSSLFQRLFLGGIREAGDWIQEQYKLRKYSHLLPLISKKIEALLQ